MQKALTFFFFLLSAAGHGQNPNGWDTAWVSSYGGANVDYASDVKQTPDHGFIIAGTTSSFGSGNTSFYIIKTDSLGKYQWSAAPGTSDNDMAASVELAGDGGYYFIGSSSWNPASSYDGYMVRTDQNGNVLYTRNYGDYDWEFLHGSCKLPDGGLLLCGETYSKTRGGTDAWLVRIDAGGDTLWTRKYGGPGDDVFNAVICTGSRVYAAGSFFDSTLKKSCASVYKLDFNGHVLGSGFFAGNTVENMRYNGLCLTQNGKLLLCGTRGSDTSDHCILRRTDTSAFTSGYYMTLNQKLHFNGVLEGNHGDMYAIGPSRGGAGGVGALCLRYDSLFTQLSYDFYGGVNDEDAARIIRAGRGYAIAGLTTSYGNRNSKSSNAFLVVLNKPDMSGNHFMLVTENFDPLSPLSLEDRHEASNTFTCYPNPVTECMTVILPASLPVEELDLTLTNALGNPVSCNMSQKFISGQGSNCADLIKLDLIHLPTGMYFLYVYRGQRILFRTKVMKR